MQLYAVDFSQCVLLCWTLQIIKVSSVSMALVLQQLHYLCAALIKPTFALSGGRPQALHDEIDDML